MAYSHTLIKKIRRNPIALSSIYKPNIIISAGGFDADAQNFFDRTSLTADQKTAVNTMVVDLKAASLWDKIYVFYPVVGGTEANHRQNLKGNTKPINASFGATVVNDSDGFHMSAAASDYSSRPVTSWYLSDILTDVGNKFFMGAYFKTEIDNTGTNIALWGMQNTTNTEWAKFDTIATNQVRGLIGPTANLAIGSFSFQGFMVADKQAGRLDIYKNGTSVANDTGITEAITSQDYRFACIGSTQNTGLAILPAVVKERPVACCIWGQTLTASEQATLSSIVVAFQTTLGRN